MRLKPAKVVNILLFLLLTISTASFIYLSFFDDFFSKNDSHQATHSKSLMITPLEGDVFDLQAISSKVIVVNFWATWCGPCLIEIPALMALQDTYAKEDLQIIGISLDDSESIVQRFLQKQSFNYPISMYSYNLQKKFGTIQSIPTTFVLDQDLTILKKLQGYHSRQTLESIIISLL